jgi:hypothetical protein
MRCFGPSGSERAMIELAAIMLAFVATSALLAVLLPERQS